MRPGTIRAIEQVVTGNRDMVELCLKRGVTVEDLQKVFRRAALLSAYPDLMAEAEARELLHQTLEAFPSGLTRALESAAREATPETDEAKALWALVQKLEAIR